MDIAFLIELGLYGTLALVGGGIGARKVLLERQALIEAKARHDAEQAAKAAKALRQLRDKQEAEAAEKSRQELHQFMADAIEYNEKQLEVKRLEAERLQHAQEEQQKEKMRRAIYEEYQRKWEYPSNSLFLGTWHANPLGDGATIPAYLQEEFEKHKSALPIWFTGAEMGLTFGMTGSGKFTTLVAPNMLLYDGSCFVVDVAGEACAVTATARRDKHKQKVFRLDPFQYTKFAPGAYEPLLASFNPLDTLDPKLPSFTSDVPSFVEALATPRPATSDPIFSDGAKEALTAIIMFVCTHPEYEGKRNLTTIYTCLTLDDIELDWMLGEMKKSTFEMVRGFANTYHRQDERLRGNLLQQAKNEVAFFTYEVIKNISSHSTFSMEDFFNGSCTIYLVLPPEHISSHIRWLRLMLAVFLKAATRYEDNQVLWIVDEAGQLGKLDVIPQAYTLLRKFGVRIWTFWQDLGQLQGVYPEHWRSLIANSFVQIIAAGDKDTAEYFSALAGEHEVMKFSESAQEGRSTGQSLGSSTGTSSGQSDGWSTGTSNVTIQPLFVLVDIR